MTIQHKPTFLTSWLIRTAGNIIAPRAEGDGRLCIVNYHRILEAPDPLLATEPDIHTFRWQMELLAKCFNVMPLHDAVQALTTKCMPPRAVCITFDDGYRSTHDLALPILTRLGLPATVFVTTGFLDEGNMWNDRIVEAVRQLPLGTIDLRPVGLGLPTLSVLEDRKNVVKQVNDACKYLTPARRIEVIERLESLAENAPTTQLMLTREMVANLARQGIEIGGHTVTHPILTMLDDDIARHEIEDNKRVLEAITGKPLRLFAYPNGKAGMDFDQRHVQMVQAAGYAAAFTTAIGAASRHSDFFQLPRSSPWDATPFLFGLRLLRWLSQKNMTPPKAAIGNTDAGDRQSAQQSVLLIAFHFPPQAESSGIQRTLSFSKNLHAQNYAPSVLSAHPIAYERKNSSQLAQLPSNLLVKRAWALDAKRHLGLSGRYPEVIALPDRWVSWWLSAVPLGLSMMRRNKTQLIWTTYPIATAHLIGLTLQYLTGKAWVADFRDPMTQDDYPKSKWQRTVFRWIEKKTMQRCAAAIFTTHSAYDTYAQRYPDIPRQKLHVIENGYEEENFKVQGASPDKARPPQNGKITLLHSGLLYSEGRDPTAFFTAIAALKQQGTLDATKFCVVLRAPGNPEYFKALILQQQLDDIVFVEPPVPYQQALNEMLAADGLLVFQGTPFNTQIPAKIYEYFRARKPIFGLLDPTGETAKVLSKAGFHSFADIASSVEIVSALKSFLVQLNAGQAFIATEELIVASSRKHRAQQLAQVFAQVTADAEK